MQGKAILEENFIPVDLNKDTKKSQSFYLGNNIIIRIKIVDGVVQLTRKLKKNTIEKAFGIKNWCMDCGVPHGSSSIDKLVHKENVAFVSAEANL